MADDPPEQQQPQFNVNTQSVSIQPLPEFSPDAEIGASLAAKWRLWIEDFDMFILASGIIDLKRKRALLLYQAGQRVREIFRQLPDTGTETDYDIAKTKLQEYFKPQQNRRYAVYRFRQAKQETHETLDQFHTRLRSLAQTCNFPDVDFEIEQQIITAGTSSRIRKRALRDPTYDLKAILLEGRRAEQSAYQAREIESQQPTQDDLHKINSKPLKHTQHVEIVEKLTLMKVHAQRKASNAANVVSTIIMLKFVAESRNQSRKKQHQGGNTINNQLTQ